MQNLRRVDDSPLFRDPATGKPFEYEYMLQIVRWLMTCIGEEPLHFGTHSLRIGGATALQAAGASETVIRTMGRWASDIFRIYVRACYEHCVSWTAKAGSTQVSSVAADFEEVDDY